jgi:exodeoxyribonuclease V alpha subunit
VTPEAREADAFEVWRAQGADGLLLRFNATGVLTSSDVQVARRLAAIASEQDGPTTLAAALAVRAPRIGHVYVDLQSISSTATVEADEPVDLSVLPWPDPPAWVKEVAASELAAVGEDEPAGRPLRLVDARLYLERYWQEERQLAEELLALSASSSDEDHRGGLAERLARLFPGETGDRQALAAAAAVIRRFAVVAGGPGTGKTTTVARIAALLIEQAAAAGLPPPLIALSAPTGKAAARLEEAVHEEAARLSIDDTTRSQLLAFEASTLHRLLGSRLGSSRFRHNRAQRLPHDVVIVDETSMVSLSLMAKLVQAVRPDARLILLGDPAQLASIEAGAVLGDIVGPAADELLMSPSTRQRLGALTGHKPAAHDPPPGCTIGDGIVTLVRGYRFGGGIAELAEAIRRADAEEALDVLRGGPSDVSWIAVDVGDREAHRALTPVRDAAVAAARRVIGAARAGAAQDAIEQLGRFRVLCGHRRGSQGVATWIAQIEGWLESELDDFSADERWYVGRPLIVNHNDYELNLYNGDTGVIVLTEDGHARAAFPRRGRLLEFSPTRLSAIDTVYAMTIHKSQGSQFDTAAVLLPSSGSRILTRELLYTAATRARTHLILVATEESVRAAIARPVARASGLGRRLWGSASQSQSG